MRYTTISLALISFIWSASACAQNNLSADIVIVGAGGAGMSAAIEAVECTDGKAKVLVLEKMAFVGGSTLLSSTAYNAGGASVQKNYTAEDYEAKLLKGIPNADEHDRANVKQLAQLTGPTADWLMAMGADLSRVRNGSQLMPKDGGAFGQMIVPVLYNRAQKLGVQFVTNAKVEELITDDKGAVVGVSATLSDGGRQNIAAKSVILAAGGFASNPELVKRFSPQWAGYPSTASVGATGEAILMAQKLGAKLDNMDLTGPQTVAYDTGRGAVSLTNVRYNGAIIVNRQGRRFADELGSMTVLGTATTKQTDGVGFLIFDQKSVDNAALMKKYKEKGYFVQAQTLKELALKLGIDSAGLADTVKRWQGFFDAKKDDDFGRTLSMVTRIDQAPFYGQKVSPASQQTFGGLERDNQGRVLKTDGTPIAGLYVAGETADQYGQGVSLGIVTGRIAARGAASYVFGK